MFDIKVIRNDPDLFDASLSKRGEGNYRELEIFYPDKFHTFISRAMMPSLVELCKDYCDTVSYTHLTLPTN